MINFIVLIITLIAIAICGITIDKMHDEMMSTNKDLIDKYKNDAWEDDLK